MRELKKRIEFEADTCSVGYNTDSNDVLVEFTSKGMFDKACYMYMSVEEANGFISLLNQAIEEVTKK